MTNENLSDEEILRLWKDPLWPSSFAGSRNVQLILKTDHGADVPLSRINRILHQEPIFLIHQRRHKKIQRRKFYLTTIGQTVQAGMSKIHLHILLIS